MQNSTKVENRHHSAQPRHWRPTTSCPVCAGGGCLLTGPRESPVAAVCRRVESPKPVGNVGWLHLVDRRGPVWQFTAWGAEVERMVREAAQ